MRGETHTRFEDVGSFPEREQSRALLSILEDMDSLTAREHSRALLNILEDFEIEKGRLEDTQRAVLNILEDLEAEKQSAQSANRLKSDFLANMSHELRTPLNAIMGFSKLMAHGKAGPISAKQQEFLGDILASADHLLRLINDVLDLAKVEAGKMEFHPERIDVLRLVGEVLAIVRAISLSKQITIDTSVAPDCVDLFLDPAKLKQVLYNYLSNALKFTPDNGRVMVRFCGEDATMFRLEVHDSGIGIAPEDVNKLFSEFRQIDSSVGKKYQGTGLGLALTRRIAEAQGGHTGVDSVLGAGSVFFAVLPREHHPSESR